MAAADISAVSSSSDTASTASPRLEALTGARGHASEPSRRPMEPASVGVAIEGAAGASAGHDEMARIFDGLVVDDRSNVGLITVDELERRYIERVLALTAGNKSRAAQILGFDRRTLYRKIERYGRSQ